MREEAEIVKELRELEKSDLFRNNNFTRTFNNNDIEDNETINKSKYDLYFDKSLKINNLNTELYQKLIEKSLEGIFNLKPQKYFNDYFITEKGNWFYLF